MPKKSAGICVEGGGIILPAHGRGPLQFIIYLLALMWCFLGVAIVADVFMGAIERITSKKVRKFNVQKAQYRTVVLWNPTVANLTLMALGSSAPEILLNVIELFGREFYSGDLGPSTIVGSAAFNLLCIIAVCISALPPDEIRSIKEVPVYVITASFSIFAYLWLLVVLLLATPHVVTPVEGISTLLLFPALVILAFMADRGYFTKKKPKMGRAHVTLSNIDKEQLAAMTNSIKQKHPSISEEQITKIVEIEIGDKHNMATRRIEATRALTGSKRVKRLSKLNTEKSGTFWNRKVTPSVDAEAPEIEEKEEDAAKCIVGFQQERIAVLENVGHARLYVTREGNEAAAFSMKYKTVEHTATRVSDYEHVEGTIEFGKNDTERKEISVKICDDVCFEDDEEFFVDLYDLKVEEGEVEMSSTRATVVIIDDDLPGYLSFDAEQKHIVDGPDQSYEIKVNRKHGSTGTITCQYKTEDGTAQCGSDYEAAEGTLEFIEGCLSQSITVNIKARGRYNCQDYFRVVITDAGGGAKMDPETDGGATECVHTIFIDPNVEEKPAVDRIMSSLQVRWDKAKVGHSNWRDQFRDAIYVNGGADDDDDDEAGGDPTVMDRVMHVITLPWKLLIACIPPTDFMGGWICFVCSLLMIGLVTAFIGDLAGLLGCTLTIHDQVTAITFVALGTSLPDTFASKTAAQQDPHADASVGNVTGSNSVNVFLGLGLPWTMGSLYWWGLGATAEWKERYGDDLDLDAAVKASGAFIVKAGGLSFSVAVFSSCALVCIFVLLLRRKFCGGELGGGKRAAHASSALLVCLWFLYVGLSSWYAMSND